MQTVRFSPKNPEQMGLKKLDENKYINIKDNSVWICIPLLDLGWGRENGFCRLPLLSYEELVKLILIPINTPVIKIDDNTFNLYGALACLLDDYPIEFLSELEQMNLSGVINKDKNKLLFELLENELYCSDDTLNKINKKDKEKYLKWKEISHIIK